MAEINDLVVVWINAFIPFDVPGYTKIIARGQNFGMSAIPLPAAARLANPTKDWDCGYLTDQRTSSDGPDASVRMRSIATIDIGRGRIVSADHPTSGTTEVNMKSGETKAFKKADMSGCKFGALIEDPSSAARPANGGIFENRSARTNPVANLTLGLSASASDPLLRAAANIHYDGTFTIVLTDKSLTISFDGKIDAFPAFECYASWRKTTMPVFPYRPPPPGNTVVSLAGTAFLPYAPVFGTVEFLIA